MDGRSEPKSVIFINGNQKQAAKWKYKIIENCAISFAEELLEEKAREGWELVSHTCFTDPRLSNDEISSGNGQLEMAHTLVFRRDESRQLDIVGDENVHSIKPGGGVE